MRERRSSKRVNINRGIRIDLEGAILDAVLVDLSTLGALFTLDAAGSKDVSNADLGRQVSFKIKPKNRPTRKYTGEIIRFYFQDDIPHLALRFWKKYEEIS